MISSVDIHNTKKEEIEKVHSLNNLDEIKTQQPVKYCCSLKQILIIVIPITVVCLFAAIFIPIYVVNKNDDDDEKKIKSLKEEYDEYEENIEYLDLYGNKVPLNATLTPKDGYDNILIFLGGISDISNKYFDFFKSKSTFVPKGTKIYFFSGPLRQMQFMIDYYNLATPVPGWFNIAANASLMPTEHDFTEAKVSLNYVLDIIDKIKIDENIDYKNIYLSGFSQGAMMTNYVLLNSRHQLGGYIAFSGYVFDHDFLENNIVYIMNSGQAAKLQSKKDYHILATHSFMDDAVFYQLAAESYRIYYNNYTDFKLLSFGALSHVLPEQPIHPYVKKWLKESMGK